MPHALARRSERRTFSRDGARQFAQPNPTTGPDRKTRRQQGRRGDVALLVHGPHDRAWLFSGTVNGGGQARVDAKRNARADYWRTVRIQVSAEFEPYFRDGLHLLGDGARIVSRTQSRSSWNPFVVDLDVHIPGAPVEAVSAMPVYRNELKADGRTYETTLDSLTWQRADGSEVAASE